VGRESQAVAVLGPGRRPRPLTFCSAPTPVFPPTTCYCFHPLGARGPGPQSVFARTATGSRFPPLCQISQLWFSKCGLTGLGIANIGNFWYKFSPKGYIPLSDFFTKFGPGTESQVRTLAPNFTVMSLKMWAYSAKNRQKFLV